MRPSRIARRFLPTYGRVAACCDRILLLDRWLVDCHDHWFVSYHNRWLIGCHDHWLIGCHDHWLVGYHDCWLIDCHDRWPVDYHDCWRVGYHDCWRVSYHDRWLVGYYGRKLVNYGYRSRQLGGDLGFGCNKLRPSRITQKVLPVYRDVATSHRVLPTYGRVAACCDRILLLANRLVNDHAPRLIGCHCHDVAILCDLTRHVGNCQ